MVLASLPRCDCCGLHVRGEPGVQDCPRCGYPTERAKEERFLENAIHDLERVATHGGAFMTVTNLIRRYKLRLDILRQLHEAPVVVAPETANDIPGRQPVDLSTGQEPRLSKLPEEKILEEVNTQAVSIASPPPVVAVEETKQMFSLKSFFEEQTINIVATLGAFLILIGALSFVTSTTDLLLSFLIAFVVHIVFGGVGIVAYRFPGLRIVAGIYTAVFALLIPLVGFSAYRLVVGNIIEVDASLLLAIAATYAAIIYGVLAVYQRFALFGYLAVVALAVADLALASHFDLSYCWWPVTLMGLALLALAFVKPGVGRNWQFRGHWQVLNNAIRLLIYVCLIVCIMSSIVTFYVSLFPLDLIHTSADLRQIRFALAAMTLSLLCWVGLFIWRARFFELLSILLYLFLVCVLVCIYALESKQLVYVLVLTGVALLFHGLKYSVARRVSALRWLEGHLDWLTLILILVPPFTVEMSRSADLTSVVQVIAIAVGLALSVSVMISRTGIGRVPRAGGANWPWLLLLSYVLLSSLFLIALEWMDGTPVWGFLGLTLVLVALAVGLRRFGSVAWANPFDVLALVAAQETALVMGLDSGALWFLLGFAALTYAVLLYQRRILWMVVPCVFALLALSLLGSQPHILLLLSIGLPLASAVVRRVMARQEVRQPWELPLLAFSAIYGAIFLLGETQQAESALQGWSGLAWPVSVEIALLALAWYASAALGRAKSWLIGMQVFALIALLVPSHTFWTLVVLAPSLFVLAFGIRRLFGLAYALPVYITAVASTIVLQVSGYQQQELLPYTAAILLLVALEIYLLGWKEQQPLLLWLAPCFAVLSLYDAGVYGDLYRAPLVALVCAGIGLGSRYIRPALGKLNRWHYALPFYTTALAAAVFTGIDGIVRGVNMPFLAAVPDALLLYALVAYVIIVFERKWAWQGLVAGLSIGATFLAIGIPSCGLLILWGFPSLECQRQVVYTSGYLTAIALGTGILGLLAGHFIKGREQKRWDTNWSWYLAALVAVCITSLWLLFNESYLPRGVEPAILCLFIGFSLLVALIERMPVGVLVAMALSVWTIERMPWQPWQQASAYTLLCVIVFAAQFLWQWLPTSARPGSPARLHTIIGLGGQVCVVLRIITWGGLAQTGMLAHIGAISLFVLAALLFWYGQMQTREAFQRWCSYSAGLCLSLVISWELSALGEAHLYWLTMPPAAFFIIVAPFILNDDVLPYHRALGQICSVLGATLLLLPMLWLSFNEVQLLPTLWLAGESLILLLLGVALRIRFFVLSGAALVVVAAIHALFLPSLGIPPSLALTILGGMLLFIATALSLARHRLQAAWTQWE
jgi:hypothetical protein